MINKSSGICRRQLWVGQRLVGADYFAYLIPDMLQTDVGNYLDFEEHWYLVDDRM